MRRPTRRRRLTRWALAPVALAATLAAILLAPGGGNQLGLISIPGGGRLNLSGHCEPPAIQVWAGFRAHVLVPHDVVGTIIDDKPTGYTVFTKTGNTYYRHGRPILRVVRHTHPGRAVVVVTALADVWLQEPGLVVKIAGGGTWQGLGPTYQSRLYPLLQKDAHRATVHFSRVPASPVYVQTVRYLDGDRCLTVYSDGGFTRLLDRPAQLVPWQGAEAFDSGVILTGTLTTEEFLRRWELAGKPPDLGQMYFLGWSGGAGAVVNRVGRTPPDGRPYDLLWQPRSWRELRRGQQISQVLVVTAS